MKLRLSDRAKADLIEIRNYTRENFGERQVAVYRGAIGQGLSTLRQFPAIGLRPKGLPDGVHAFRVREHWVCYEIRGDVVLIAAIVRNLGDFEQDDSV